MTTDIGAGPGELVSLLETATDQVSHLRRRIHHTITHLEEMIEGGSDTHINKTELQRQLKDLREVTTTVIKEETRVAEECRKLSAELEPGSYDIAGARSEIGERLARLRAARRDGGVSGQPE